MLVFKGSIGDFISGTMARPWQNPTVESVFFVFNMIGIILYYTTHCFTQRTRIRISQISAIILGTIALLVASSVLLFLFLIISLMASYIIILCFSSIKPFIKKRYIFLFLLLGTLSTFYYYTSIVGHSSLLIERSLSVSARIRVSYDILSEFPKQNVWYAWLGKGPGQMLSKASWLRSGYSSLSSKYEPLAIIQAKHTKESEDYIFNTITQMGIYENSATHSPFYTMLQVLSEFGWLGIVALLSIVLYFMRKIIKKGKKYSNLPYANAWCFITLTFIFFFTLASLQGYTLEISQAMFIPCILAVISYARIGQA